MIIQNVNCAVMYYKIAFNANIVKNCNNHSVLFVKKNLELIVKDYVKYNYALI